jgi:serine/threonine protein kinase
VGPPFLQLSELPGFLGKLGHYEIRRLIGRGGMGLVYEGFDPILKRAVAIKVLAPLTALSTVDRDRFLREARAAAALDHEHIVAIHNVDQIQGMPFLVLQYIAGESLADRLRRTGRLPFAEVVRLAVEVARGLATAHAKGLIHRDIKPANILLEQESGRAKIADFGLVKDMGDATLTLEGTVAGTPEFMSPEQASGSAVDARTDLFSLGVVLYTASSGLSPFRASGPLLTLQRVRESTPRPLREVDPSLPAWFCEIVGQLLAKDPRQRVESAAALVDLLEGQVTPPGKSSRYSTRRRVAVLAGLATVLAVVSILYLSRPTSPSSGTGPKSPPESGFVVSGQDTVFRRLGDAVAAARDNDTIDVYGDGPYPTVPLRTERKRLTIRAASRAQPVILSEVPNRPVAQPFFTTDSDLRLEGLTIYWSLELPPGKSEAEALARCAIVATRGEVALDHCRVVTGRLNGCLGVTGGTVALNNCHFAGDGVFGVFWHPAPGGRLTAEQCVFEGRVGMSVIAIAETTKAARATLELSHNTFAVERSFQLALFPGPRQPLEISARSNIFDNAQHCVLMGLINPKKPEPPKPDEMINQLRSVAKWSEEGNVHRRGSQYITAQRPGGVLSAEVDSAALWLKLWNLLPERSVEGSIQFRKRADKSDAEPLRLDRVNNPSGPLPARIGADPDRVGPGPAYHAKR